MVSFIGVSGMLSEHTLHLRVYGGGPQKPKSITCSEPRGSIEYSQHWVWCQSGWKSVGNCQTHSPLTNPPSGGSVHMAGSDSDGPERNPEL